MEKQEFQVGDTIYCLDDDFKGFEDIVITVTLERDNTIGYVGRDYIHVVDLANAHIKAIEYLRKEDKSNIFNLGNGSGFSVKEMIIAARKVTGHEIPAKICERRAGDPARLIASAEKAREILMWEPEFTNVEDIIASAWNWHKNNPKGFNK